MPSWRDTEGPGEPDSTRNTAGPASVIAGTTTMPATWPARTYHRLPRRYHPWADRPASTLSDPGDQRPSSPAAATVPVTDPSASRGSQYCAAVWSPASSSAPAARPAARNGPGYSARPSSVWTTPASAWD